MDHLLHECYPGGLPCFTCIKSEGAPTKSFSSRHVFKLASWLFQQVSYSVSHCPCPGLWVGSLFGEVFKAVCGWTVLLTTDWRRMSRLAQERAEASRSRDMSCQAEDAGVEGPPPSSSPALGSPSLRRGHTNA